MCSRLVHYRETQIGTHKLFFTVAVCTLIRNTGMTSIYHFSSGKCLHENVPHIVTVEQKIFYKTGAMSLKYIHINTNQQLYCTSAVSITHLQPDTSTVGMFFVRRALEEWDIKTNCDKVWDE